MKFSLAAPTVTVFLAAIAGCVSTPTPQVAVAPVAAAPVAQRELGLTPRQHGDTTVYCRTEAAIGTRLQTMTCYTRDELPALAKRMVGNQEAVEDIRKKSLIDLSVN
jgi:hypothetical protein